MPPWRDRHAGPTWTDAVPIDSNRSAHIFATIIPSPAAPARFWITAYVPACLVRGTRQAAAGPAAISAILPAAGGQRISGAARQSAAQQVQPQIERGTRMGEGADGDEIDAGLRDRPGLLQP